MSIPQIYNRIIIYFFYLLSLHSSKKRNTEVCSWWKDVCPSSHLIFPLYSKILIAKLIIFYNFFFILFTIINITTELLSFYLYFRVLESGVLNVKLLAFSIPNTKNPPTSNMSNLKKFSVELQWCSRFETVQTYVLNILLIYLSLSLSLSLNPPS